MTSSIPIPPRAHRTRSATPTFGDTTRHFGQSLPSHATLHCATPNSTNNATTNNNASNEVTRTTSATVNTAINVSGRTVRSKSSNHGHGHRRRHHLSQDDMAVESIELISKAARRWKSSSYSSSTPLNNPAITPTNSTASSSSATLTANNDCLSNNTKTFLHATLRDADYSEVVTASDQVRTAFQEGAAVTKRPPRQGVSGTYFFCQGEGDGNTIGVFKPMDEEAPSFDMSPPPSSSISAFVPTSLPNLQLDSIEMLASRSKSSHASTSAFFQPSSPPANSVRTSFSSDGTPSPLFSSNNIRSVLDENVNSNNFNDNTNNNNNTNNDNSKYYIGNTITDGNNDYSGNESKVTLGRSNANGFHPGEGAYREVAAYILDHKRFAGVPQTALMRWDKPCKNSEEHPNYNFLDDDDIVEDHEFDFSHEENEVLDAEDREFEREVIIRNGNVNHPFGEDDEDGCTTGATTNSDGYLSTSDNHSRTDVDSISGELRSEDDGNESIYSFEGETEGATTPGGNNRKNFQTKRGAFQVYVQNLGDADDFGPGVFDKDQVHKIAVLDIRTINHDRHGGNILVRKASSSSSLSDCWSSSSCSGYSSSSVNSESNSKKKFDLVPIDHGYILPDRILNVPWPIWMDWPMIKEPVSDEIKEYIQFLDAERDARKLQEELKNAFRPGALQSFKIATTLLQKGIAAGLNLYEIGLLMYTRRDDPNDRSELEKIVYEAEEASLARDRHIAEQRLREEAAMGHMSGMLENTKSNMEGDSNSSNNKRGLLRRHHRHQSSNAIFSSLNGWKNETSYIDEYVVKYASKMIQEMVNRVALAKLKPPKPERFNKKSNLNSFSPLKMNENGNGTGESMNGKVQLSRQFNGASFNGTSARGFLSSGKPCYLTRVRSIPDFGIGEKPIHVIQKQRGTLNGHGVEARAPTPTPASSPLASRMSPLQTTPPVMPKMGSLVSSCADNSNNRLRSRNNGKCRISSTKPVCNESTSSSSRSASPTCVVNHSRGPGTVSAPIEIPINDDRVKRIDLSLISRHTGVGNATVVNTKEDIYERGDKKDVHCVEEKKHCVRKGVLDDKSSPVSPMSTFKWSDRNGNPH